MDRLKSLEIFACVADQGSLTRCADTLSITRSAVSRAVNDLESLLKLRLFQRSTRKITLTREGREVLDHARELLHGFRAIEAIGRHDGMEVVGDIRLSAPSFFGVRRLGPALTSFVSKHPEARIDLQLSDGAVDLIGSGIDLAIVIARRLPQSVIARHVGDAAMGVYGSPDYVSRRGVIAHPSQLRMHDCLTCTNLSADGIEWAFASVDAGQAEIYRPRPVGRLNSNSHEALLNAALHGLGVAMLPDFVAEEAVASGLLLRMLDGWATAPVGVHLVYASRAHQPQRLRRLIDHLTESLEASHAMQALRLVDAPVHRAPRFLGAKAPRPLERSEGAWRVACPGVLEGRPPEATGPRLDGAEAIGA